jgi:hypothetical protein
MIFAFAGIRQVRIRDDCYANSDCSVFGGNFNQYTSPDSVEQYDFL